MAEYLAHLLNSGHSDRQHVLDVLDEYLSQSDGSESNNNNNIYLKSNIPCI